MAVTMFTRFAYIRNVMNVNNISAVGGALNIKRHSNDISEPTTLSNEMKKILVVEGYKKSQNKLSKPMQMYLERSKQYQEFIEKESVKYNIGKRHLANMMGEDPNAFTEKDVEKAIKYLLPSGMYDWRARPMMTDPKKLYEERKEAEFDETGRPYHFLFYTCKPNYYNLLHNIAEHINNLNNKEDLAYAAEGLPSSANKINMLTSNWISKEELEKKLLEQLLSHEYNYFIKSLDRLTDHSMSKHVSDFIMTYRKELTNITTLLELPPFEYDENDRPFILVKRNKRKSAVADVKVIGKGSGKITINGQDLSYFQFLQQREQVIFPLIFSNMADKVDIEATVTGGGLTGQSGAIRMGIALGLRNFVSIEMVEKMRLAGLLTHDPRKRERKKFGQEGARRKFTWKKR